MEKTVCPNAHVYFEGSQVSEDGQSVTHIRKRLPCNMWNCPVCRPEKLKQTRKRVLKGKIAQLIETKNGYRPNKYAHKLLLLTCPGEEYRKTHTPAQAHDEMKRNWNKLKTYLFKEYGSFHYFLVVELHEDGFPHFHVLLVGDSVAPFSIRSDIKRLWEQNYGMGFANIKWLDKGAKYAVHYVTKYLTKAQQPIRRFARFFTSSRDALAPVQRYKPFWLAKSVQKRKVGQPELEATVSLSRPFTLSRHVWDSLAPQLKWEMYPDLLYLSDQYLYDDQIPF